MRGRDIAISLSGVSVLMSSSQRELISGAKKKRRAAAVEPKKTEYEKHLRIEAIARLLSSCPSASATILVVASEMPDVANVRANP